VLECSGCTKHLIATRSATINGVVPKRPISRQSIIKRCSILPCSRQSNPNHSMHRGWYKRQALGELHCPKDTAYSERPTRKEPTHRFNVLLHMEIHFTTIRVLRDCQGAHPPRLYRAWRLGLKIRSNLPTFYRRPPPLHECRSLGVVMLMVYSL
jgi:hypothetical protein